MLNPFSFKTTEDFQKALMSEGLKNGWTPIAEKADDVVEKILSHCGHIKLK